MHPAGPFWATCSDIGITIHKRAVLSDEGSISFFDQTKGMMSSSFVLFFELS